MSQQCDPTSVYGRVIDDIWDKGQQFAGQLSAAATSITSTVASTLRWRHLLSFQELKSHLVDRGYDESICSSPISENF